MKIQGTVLKDEIRTWEKRGDFPAGKARQVTIMDRDDTPLQAPLTVTIDEDDPICPANKGASCEGLVVTLAVWDIRQSPDTKKIGGRGHLVSLDGRLVLQPLENKKAA